MEIFNDDNRKLIREGPVIFGEGRNKERRYLFLFNDLYLITKQQNKNKNFIYLSTFNLNERGLILIYYLVHIFI